MCWFVWGGADVGVLCAVCGLPWSQTKPLTRVKQSWAYQFGYINSVIQAVKRSRGCAWDDVRIKLDPSAKAKQGWLVPKL
jgi:hypothetical protein